MRKNIIPAVIAFAPAVLLPLVQDVLRPRVSHASWLGIVLSWAPDLVVGFCFPFSILIGPRVWTSQTATRLFRILSVLTVVALLLDECLSPFGPNVFDPADIAAGLGGVVLAGLVFHTFLRGRLTFRDDEATLGRERTETFACDLAALDDEQRSRRARLAGIIRAKAIRVVERPDGYVVHLGPDRDVVRLAEELIELEQKCCPFLRLTLGRDETRGGAVLEITADVEAKMFIASELGIVGVRGSHAG